MATIEPKSIRNDKPDAVIAADVETPADLLRRRMQRIPLELRQRPAWVAWRFGPVRTNGKRPKEPIDPATGRLASVSRPGTWGTFSEALNRCEQDKLDGIGFVLSDDDPYSCADLDECLDPNTKEIDPKMYAILEALNSYSEVSPYGTGIHVWVQGKVDNQSKKPVEIYSRKHMITVTGRSLSDFPSEIKKRTDELADLRRQYAPAKATASISEKAPIPVTSEQHRRIPEKIMDSSNGRKFARLWDGDCSGYPSQSEADLALCRILAPYCGCREDIVDQLFRQSAMFRDKWDEVHYENGCTYGEETVDLAVESALARLRKSTLCAPPRMWTRLT